MSKEVVKRSYELRELQAHDMFPMFSIINKIGIKDFKKAFESEQVMEAIAKATDENGEGKVDVTALGVTVVLDVAMIIIQHVPDIEEELYKFLMGLSNMKRKEIENMGMGEFLNMIMDVIRKPEFSDFIGVASKLFK